MKNILVDMHRLKQNPFNGLYTFSYHLGKSLAALSPGDLDLYFYLPKDKVGIFGNDQHLMNFTHMYGRESANGSHSFIDKKINF